MRDKINAFYYPDFVANTATLMRAILLFDEIHLMDRPSFQFGQGMASFGLIGANSPLRQYEQSFRDEGVPFYVHDLPTVIFHPSGTQRLQPTLMTMNSCVAFKRD